MKVSARSWTLPAGLGHRTPTQPVRYAVAPQAPAQPHASGAGHRLRFPEASVPQAKDFRGPWNNPDASISESESAARTGRGGTGRSGSRHSSWAALAPVDRVLQVSTGPGRRRLSDSDCLRPAATVSVTATLGRQNSKASLSNLNGIVMSTQKIVPKFAPCALG